MRRVRDADDIESGLPRARNDYDALEQALREAAPHLMAASTTHSFTGAYELTVESVGSRTITGIFRSVFVWYSA